ncbi:hypothetical protein U0035_02275 [Niabella yanshanensis]|uniref:SecDF P1 head subdomain domain-containing protein n=1 Tax=Niabella yanshanensis TaxID=577386 RepID=A0ABZ0W756_9BACT|nr:hypothetical protein [Niabella yanshanensis]WQD38971.1 hypothetical protein U0035_02275 [Niabella yanshanensis]
MKQVLLLISLFIMVSATPAQNANQDRYRQYAGKYGGNSGVCLFNDGRFMLYGYSTAVFGSYSFKDDDLQFITDKPELFEVYAHDNSTLGDSTRMNFAGFEEGKTFVQFNEENRQRVFNDDANCFDAPFVYETDQQLTRFTLSYIRENVWWDLGRPNPSWQYGPAKKYNDFILIFNKPKREYENFAARFAKVDGRIILQLSNYGGEEGFIKQVPDKEEQKQWQEILEWKKQYDESKTTTVHAVFANKHYRLFPSPDSLNYISNDAANEYISRQADDNEEYFRSNQYQDDRLLRKYIKLVPQNKDTANFTEDNGADNSIFYVVCGEGTRPPYRYQGFVTYEEKKEEERIPLIVTGPAPLLETNPNKIADQDPIPDSINNNKADEIVTLLKPFAVNRPDGFYTIEKKNDDYTLTVLAANPSLTPKDFDSVVCKTGTHEESIIEIRFNKVGAVKFEKFSKDQVGNQVALVADHKVIMMPFVAEPITKGRIDISGNYSAEEAKAIVKRLQHHK